ncbi:MAG: YolD-like family protein [Bacillota bacterium]
MKISRERLLDISGDIPVKPHLDEEAQAEIEQRINAALATRDIVRVMGYTDQGLVERVGVITAVSLATREIKMETADG